MFQSKIEETKNNFNKESPLNGTVIQNFYDGANIFITGGTGESFHGHESLPRGENKTENFRLVQGFMGKVLIDKLLRTCPGIENIYLLIRKKKGKDIHTRIEELFDDPVSLMIEGGCA